MSTGRRSSLTDGAMVQRAYAFQDCLNQADVLDIYVYGPPLKEGLVNENRLIKIALANVEKKARAVTRHDVPEADGVERSKGLEARDAGQNEDVASVVSSRLARIAEKTAYIESDAESSPTSEGEGLTRGVQISCV